MVGQSYPERLQYFASDMISYVELDCPSPAIPEQNERLVNRLFKRHVRKRACPYCRSHLAVDTDYIRGKSWTTHTMCLYASIYGERNHKTPQFHAFMTCGNCGWWSFYEGGFYFERDYVSCLHWGKMCVFNVSDVTAPVEALRKYISRKPTILYDIHPTSLERIVASCFSDFFNCEAVHVGGPGDRGVDVILVDGDKPTIVQVKRRCKPKSVESVSTIRELLGILLVQGRYSGIVVSTANRFSKAALLEANIPVIRNMGYRVTLYNYDALVEVVRRTSPKTPKPWECLWKAKAKPPSSSYTDVWWNWNYRDKLARFILDHK